MTNLSGKTALVTGASRGIGRATALALATAGAQVVIHYGSGANEAEAVVVRTSSPDRFAPRSATGWISSSPMPESRKQRHGGTMELPGTSYLCTLALLGMTFMGFAAIVMLLRQTLGRDLRAFDVLFARAYMEFAVIVSMGAMLPALLMLWDLPIGAVWRLSSGLVGLPLLVIALGYPARRRATYWRTHAALRPRERHNHFIDQPDPLDCFDWHAQRTIGSGVPGCPDRIPDFGAGGLAPSAEHYPCAGGGLNGRRARGSKSVSWYAPPLPHSRYAAQPGAKLTTRQES
jgi:hypothetical protein